jgi:hypothetical protein
MRSRVVAMATNTLTPLGEGIWTSTVPVQFIGLHLTATMTIVRLGNGSLLLHSPAAMSPGLRRAVDQIGPVAHLYSPNTFHHLHLGDWADAYPAAKVHGPSGLVRKRPDLRIDRTHTGGAEPAFAGVIDEVRIDGFRLEESVLHYRPARTVLVADLVHNIGTPTHAWTRFYTKVMGFYDCVGLSRFIRWTAFPDRAAARRSIDAVLAWQFENLIVGHGTPVLGTGRAALAETYAWLPSLSALVARRRWLNPSGCA